VIFLSGKAARQCIARKKPCLGGAGRQNNRPKTDRGMSRKALPCLTEREPGKYGFFCYF